MAKKILILIYTVILSVIIYTENSCTKAHSAASFENSTKISKGVMLQAYPMKTISTASFNEGDIVYFINPTDLWAYETKVLPKNTYFRGYIEMLKMPVKGVNAAITIKITEAILPDGSIKKMNATVTQNGNAQIGGNLTPPASYNKTVHPREGMYWKRAGVLQYVPSGEYEMGLHITLPTSDIIYIMLDEEYDSSADSIKKENMHK
ncbi:MAG: hypothetical protein OSJ27_05690 [Candidatus Gastranaerophilales bacterium]|nr:hypothetical protein [Candidatus Gastranaerophilales bacterium]